MLLTIGTKGQAGEWNEAARTKLLDEPTDIAFARSGDFLVIQGHGRGEPKVLRFFLGRLAPTNDWPTKLVAQFRHDFGESL